MDRGARLTQLGREGHAEIAQSARSTAAVRYSARHHGAADARTRARRRTEGRQRHLRRSRFNGVGLVQSAVT